MEIWKDIKGFETAFQVSTLGRVRSLTRQIKHPEGDYIKQGKLLGFTKDNKGYPNITLCWKGKRRTVKIHTLVAEAFIIKVPSYTHVNHIDGNKNNNTLQNLERCTPQQNIVHAHRLGLAAHNEKHVRSKLNDKQAREIKIKLKQLYVGKRIKLYKELAEQYQVHPETIRNIDKGTTWRNLVVED